MRFAYADPPYLGCAVRLYGDHPEAAVYDTIEGHAALVRRLVAEFPDGWALSMTSGNLFDLVPVLLAEVPRARAALRVASWVKPFASFKPNVNPAYAWEPVIFCGGRKRGRDLPTVRDWVSAPITLQKGLCGAKPPAFCYWIFDLLGAEPGDELADLFPGTGGVGEAWRRYMADRERVLIGGAA